MTKTRFSQLSAKNDVKCDGTGVVHIDSLQTIYFHIERCFIPLERKDVSLYFGIKQALFGLSSLF